MLALANQLRMAELDLAVFFQKLKRKIEYAVFKVPARFDEPRVGRIGCPMLALQPPSFKQLRDILRAGVVVQLDENIVGRDYRLTGTRVHQARSRKTDAAIPIK